MNDQIQILTNKYNALSNYTAEDCLEYWTEVAKLDQQITVNSIGHNFTFSMKVANKLKNVSMKVALDFAKSVILTTGNVR